MSMVKSRKMIMKTTRRYLDRLERRKEVRNMSRASGEKQGPGSKIKRPIDFNQRKVMMISASNFFLNAFSSESGEFLLHIVSGIFFVCRDIVRSRSYLSTFSVVMHASFSMYQQPNVHPHLHFQYYVHHHRSAKSVKIKNQPPSYFIMIMNYIIYSHSS